MFPTVAGASLSDRSGLSAGFGRRRLRAVVFDLDGTLADTAADIATAVNRVLARDGLAALGIEQVKPMIGDGSRKLLERAYLSAGARLDEAELDAALGAFIALYPVGTEASAAAYSGVRATLDRLAAAGLALGVCTNKPQAPAERLVADLGLAGYFGALIGGDRLAVRKPDPRHVLAVLDALGVPPSEAAMVGDGAQDIAAARGACVPVIAFQSGYGAVPADDLAADTVALTFAEIPDLLAALS